MKFYKYCSPKDYSLDSLSKGQLYFNYSGEFNDPFDSKLHFKNRESEEWDNKYRNCTVICCFSKNNKNILLWSHYSDKHKGFCLGFNAIKINKYPLIEFIDSNLRNFYNPDGKHYLPLRKVYYSRIRPSPFNPLKDDDKKLLEPIFNKSDVWKYETEYRMITIPYHFKTNVFSFNKSFLSDIYIGLKCDEKIKNKIKRIVDIDYLEKGYNVNIYQAKENLNRYDIVFEKL